MEDTSPGISRRLLGQCMGRTLIFSPFNNIYFFLVYCKTENIEEIHPVYQSFAESQRVAYVSMHL
jgi:hypothetical protein